MIKDTIKMEKSKKKEKKLKILAAGDFHGDSRTAEKLAEKAKKAKVDIVILIGDLVGFGESKDIIKPFVKKKQEVLFVPGNWETEQDIERFSHEYKIKNLEDHYLRHGNVGIFGIGSQNWTLFPDEKATFKKLRKDFSKIKNLEKKILVSHIHAAGTKSELSGIPGSKGLRKAIEKFRPDLFISGHIHELEGVSEKIGKTKVINVGRTGKILEV